MTIKSPLSNIIEEIRQLIPSANKYQDFLKRIKAAIRVVLIDQIIGV